MFMKKSMFTGIAASIALMALTGCGENVDGINAEFASKEGTSAEHDFDGYTFVVTDDAMKEAKVFARENKISTRIQLGDDGKYPSPPEVDFEGDSYGKVEDLTAALNTRLETVKEEAQKEAQRIKTDFEENVAKQKTTIDGLKAQMSEYTSMISDETAAVEKLSTEYNQAEAKIKERKEQFYAEFKQTVIDAELPINADKRVEPSRFFRYGNKNRCGSLSETVALKEPTSSRHCVYSTINDQQAALRPVFASYGADYHLLDKTRDEAKDKLNAARKSLKDAKIIAANKTGVNASRIERSIKSEERKIESLEANFKYDGDVSEITRRMVRRDSELQQLEIQYQQAASSHNVDARLEGLKRSGYEVESFDDEDAVLELDEDAKALVLYVFTDENDKQTIYMSAARGKDGQKTYGDLFESRTKKVRKDIEISAESDVFQAVKTMI
tara:strand:- start:13062 stop:14387 length:1326 start_codon:yes stop_codon:yes gene_type:complete